ncbi:MAG: hypothetical protein JZD41_02140 [Thermoproteus sp.]|nr:hypothetical protein [Thermoproteus sp.]
MEDVKSTSQKRRGRPPKASRKVRLEVDDDVARTILMASLSDGGDISEIIRNALKNYIEYNIYSQKQLTIADLYVASKFLGQLFNQFMGHIADFVLYQRNRAELLNAELEALQKAIALVQNINTPAPPPDFTKYIESTIDERMRSVVESIEQLRASIEKSKGEEAKERRSSGAEDVDIFSELGLDEVFTEAKGELKSLISSALTQLIKYLVYKAGVEGTKPKVEMNI